jgi:hypothetical protein
MQAGTKPELEGTTGIPFEYRLALPAGSPQNAAVKAVELRTLFPLNPENDVSVYIVVHAFVDLGQPFGAGGRRKPR